MTMSICTLLKTKAKPLLVARKMHNNNAGHSRRGRGPVSRTCAEATERDDDKITGAELGNRSVISGDTAGG